MATLSINEKEGYKLIDPYEDINLLYFMKFNKQMDGISKSQVKRITRLSEKFRFKNDNETVEILKNETTMLAAENDYKKFMDLNTEAQGFRRDCIEFFNLIRTAAKSINDEFLELTDYSGNKIVYYVYDQQIYIPHCEDNHEIELILGIEEYGMCFEDVPLIWYKVEENGGTIQGNKTGYLRKAKIIMDKSRRINCHDKEDSTFEINNETLIKGTSTGENYKYELIKNNRPYYKLQDIQLRRINYEHFMGIAKPIETLSKFSLIIIDNAEFHYTDSREIQDNTVRNKIITYIDEVEKEWKNLKRNNIIYYKYSNNYNNNNNNNNNNNRNNHKEDRQY